MSIASEVHTLWGADTALSELLPASRVFTGRAPRDTAMPYAVLSFPAGARRKRTRDNVYRDEMLRITVWSKTYDAGEPIQQAIVAAFDNLTVVLADPDGSSSGSESPGTMVDVQHDDGFALEDEDVADPAWQIVTQFNLVVGRPRTR